MTNDPSVSELPVSRSQLLAVRVPTELYERVNAFLARWQDDNRGASLTRADAVRALLERALDTCEPSSVAA